MRVRVDEAWRDQAPSRVDHLGVAPGRHAAAHDVGDPVAFDYHIAREGFPPGAVDYRSVGYDDHFRG